MSLDNPLHLAFLLLLVLLVFGAKRLPELGRSLGSGMRGFRDALSGDSATASPAAELTQPAQAPAAAPLTASAPEPAAAVATPVTHDSLSWD